MFLLKIIYIISLILISSCLKGETTTVNTPSPSIPINPGASAPDSDVVTSPETPVNPYITNIEYTRSTGLSNIKAGEAYFFLSQNNMNIAGDNVVVAVIDTGINLEHIDLKDNIYSNGQYNRNYIDNNIDVDDDNGHGSHISGIISGERNSFGTHGVAFNSKIIASKVLDMDGFGTVSNIARAIVDASNNGAKVINLSLGSVSGNIDIGSTVYDNVKALYNNAFTAVRDQDVALAVAAGNSRSTDYVSGPAVFAGDSDLDGRMIAVVATNSRNRISSLSQSNHCKQVREFCLAAPGESIPSASYTNNSGYSVASGTSQAAPHVAGAMAVLRGAWSHLTAKQTVEILLDTATDLGETGTDDIYGRGLLNLEDAVRAQGRQSVASSSIINGNSGYDFRDTSLVVNSLFGDAFQSKISTFLEKTVFFDKYGRDYNADLNNKIIYNYQDNNLDYLLSSNYWDNRLFNKFSISDSSSLQTRLVRDTNNRINNLNDSDNVALFYTKNLKNNSRIGFSRNYFYNNYTNNNSLDNKFDFIQPVIFSFNPYVNNQQNIHNNQLQFFASQYIKNIKIDLSYTVNNNSSNAEYSVKNQLFDSGISYNIDDNFKIGATYGYLQEGRNNLLGSFSNGALGNNNVNTNYISFNFDKIIKDNIHIMSSYVEGRTKIISDNSSIFRNFSEIKSKALSFAMLYNGENNKFGIVYRQPLRIYQGAVDIDLPTSRDLEGNITRFQKNNISITPAGKERNIELFFGNKINDYSNIKLNLLARNDTNNIEHNFNYSFFVRYNLNF